MKKIVVIGGGAAGMLAAACAAEGGAQVTLLEKMPQPGKKLRITGKGRCNLTNDAPPADIIKNLPGNGKFLYSAIQAFQSADVVAFFNRLGVPTKVERGGRVFPVSDQAADAVDALRRALLGAGAKLVTGCKAAEILTADGTVRGVCTADQTVYEADAVILATGGASYPATGSSGDGYRMARALGHTIVPLKPSLVPLETEEDWVKEAQGLSLRNVRLTILADGKKKAELFGEMLFTHFGISGPLVLSASRAATQALSRGQQVDAAIDLKPALSSEVLDKRIQRDFEAFSRKQLKNALHDLLPAKLIGVVMDLAYLDPDKWVHQITRAERQRLVDTLKRLTLTVKGPRPIEEAIVTAGGVATKEIDPKTMASKLVRGLYFAGEVVDVDGYTGGYNLQAAFSMGHAAGCHAAATD